MHSRKLISVLLSACIVVGAGSNMVFADADDLSEVQTEGTSFAEELPEDGTETVDADDSSESDDTEDGEEIEEAEVSAEDEVFDIDTDESVIEEEEEITVEEEETFDDILTFENDASIPIDSDNFPDLMFRDYILDNIDDGDGYLSEEEIASVTSLDVHDMQIGSLAGISYFTELTELDCHDNYIQYWELSGNTKLCKLYCQDNQMNYIDISGISALADAVDNGSRNPEIQSYFQFENGDAVICVDHNDEVVSADTLFLSVEYYDANGADEDDDSNAFIAAAGEARYYDKHVIIIIPSGTYYLGNKFSVLSDTTILADEDAVMISAQYAQGGMVDVTHVIPGTTELCQRGDSCTHGGYSQAHDITIIGGVWDRGSQIIGYETSAFVFRHCSNITFSDMTIKNCTGHFLNVSGCSNVTISNVTFTDALRSSVYSRTSQYEYVEAVHTDYINKTGEDSYLAMPFDNTPSVYITVTGCSFINVMSGIGTHHAAGDSNKRGAYYTITGNVFNNLVGYCLQADDFDHVVFSDNTCTKCTSMTLIYDSSDVNLDNNSYNSPSTSDLRNDTRCAVYFDGVSNSSITGNSIADSLNDPISIKDNSSSITISDNIISGAARYAVYVSTSSAVNVMNCNITGTGAGYSAIQFEAVSGSSSISDNTIVSTSTSPKPGSTTYSDGINVKSSTGVRISNNSVSNTGRRGIYLNNGSSRCSIIGNTINNVPNEGIFVEGKTGALISSTIIEENEISNTGSHGIDLKYCDYTTVKFNVITGYGSGKYDIHQSQCTHTTIERYHNDGWFYDSDTKKYYYYQNNVAVTGWKKIGSKWYHFASDGSMHTGWQKLSGKWYYFGSSSSGVMVTGWQKISSKWYFFNSNGDMKTGWYQEGGKWYHFSSDGSMHTGWQKLSGKWYYFNGGGDMRTGWLKSGGNWYYFDTSGIMVTGSKKIGNKTYRFDSNGVCLNP